MPIKIKNGLLFVQPPARMTPRTIENTREPDETVCRPDDDEVLPFFSPSPFEGKTCFENTEKKR